MELGMIGLGRMGANMVQRLRGGGHRVVIYDVKPEAVQYLIQYGPVPATSIADLVKKLGQPRAVWLMVPAGEPTEKTVNSLAVELADGDAVIDGGNANYKDSMRRAVLLSHKGIKFLDVGVSGGIWGLTEGYCLMVGGEMEAFQWLEPVFQSLAPSPTEGYGYVGPSGAGHFVKMVHNGIEYGLMQSYAEGFQLLQAKTNFNLDLRQVAQVWRHGSVVRSWLLDLAAKALEADPKLESIAPYVEDSGEGRWAVQESIDLAVPLAVITQSLQARFRSRQEQSFSDKLVAALRHQFGGHRIKKTG